MNFWTKLTGIAALSLLAGSCDFGYPTESNVGTEVEGLTGNLVDGGGHPAPQVRIRLYPVTDSVAGTPKIAWNTSSTAAVSLASDSTLTNAAGAFRFKNLPHGTYNLYASTQHGDTLLSLLRRSIVVNQTVQLGADTLRVSGGVLLHVRMGGAPATGASCFIGASPWNVPSDSLGACLLSGIPPGAVRISVKIPGYPAVVTDSISVTSGQVTDGGNVRLGTAEELPEAPAPIAPAAFATDVVLAPALSWESVAGATHYRLQVSTDSTFTTGVVDDSSLTDTGKTVGSLSASTTYYWRVSAKNAAGSGAYSVVRRFTTAAEPTAPASPLLSLPTDGAVNVAFPVTLSWASSVGAAAYRLQIATDSGFTALAVEDSTLTDTTRVIDSLEATTTYYWRVKAGNGIGNSAYSVARRFTTAAEPIAPPSPPILSLPADNAAGVSFSPTLSWQSWPAPGIATQYRLQIATDSAFNVLAVDDSLLPVPSTVQEMIHRAVPSLAGGTTHYWRVLAIGPGGVAVSATRRFSTTTTVGASPAAPSLHSPDNGVTDQGRTMLLGWYGGASTTHFRVELALDAQFRNIATSDSVLPYENSGTENFTTRIVGPLAASTAYYWRVIAIGPGGVSISPTKMFTTWANEFVPDAPELVSPSYEAANVLVSTTLKWGNFFGSGYHVQLATDSSFTNLLIDSMPVITSPPTLSAGPLVPGTKYYWRVRGAIPYIGPWSTVWSFTTEPAASAPPAATTLSSPAAFATISSTTGGSLTWNAAGTATSYQVQLSDNASFSTLLLNDSVVIGTSRQTPALVHNTEYFWRVRPRNAAGFGPYSSVGTFYTGTEQAGTNWVVRPSGTLANLMAAASNGTTLVVVGDSGRILTSADGISWAIRNSGTANMLRSVAWSGTRFVAVGNLGTILVSPDGTAWTAKSAATTSTLYAVAARDTQLVATGAGGLILTSSTDGDSWSGRLSGVSTALYAVTSARLASDTAQTQLVAVGAAGRVLTSPNGITWTSRTSGTSSALHAASSFGAQVAFAGAGGIVRTSQDGISWGTNVSGLTADLQGVAWDNASSLVVVGGGIAAYVPGGATVTGPTAAGLRGLVKVGTGASAFVLIVGDGGRIVQALYNLPVPL